MPTRTEELLMKIRVRCDDWPFVRFPSRLLTDNSLTDGAKVTYGALAIWGGLDGKAWPARTTLSAARGVEVRTLQRHIVALHDAGWITRTVDGEGAMVRVHIEPVRGDTEVAPPRHESRPPPTPESPEREEGKRHLKENYTCAFEEWWKAWPKKQNKPAAARAYKKALKAFSHSELIRMAGKWLRDFPCEARYVPMGSSWLNGRRWEDEVMAETGPAIDHSTTQRAVERTRDEMDRIFRRGKYAEGGEA